MLTPEDVRKRIQEIKQADADDEAHAMEDALHRSVLRAISRDECIDPAQCARLALSTQKLKFKRWYA